MDPDPDPAIFVINLQDAIKKLITYYLLKVQLHHSLNIKVIKKSQNSRYHGFSYYFCLLIGVSGSVTLTYGSGKLKRILKFDEYRYTAHSWRNLQVHLERIPKNCFRYKGSLFR